MTAQRSRALFWGVFAVLCAAALLPLAATRILPQNDAPNHLSVAYILHHIDDPGAGLRPFYDVSIPPVPYIGYYLLVHGFAYLFGVEGANVLVLGAHVLSLPVAALVWARRTRRGPWACVLAFPLAYSFSWSIGFHPFNIGLSIFLFAAAALDAFLERPRWSSAALTALLALASDFGHPLTVAALYAAAAALFVAHRPRPRRLLAAIGLLLPGAALFAWQLLGPRIGWTAPRSAAGPRFAGEYPGLLHMVEHFPQYTMDSVSGPVDTWLFWVFTGSLIALLAADRLLARGELPASRSSLHRHRAGLVGLAMAALYLALPLHLQAPIDWWFVSGRYAPLVCFFVFLLPSGRLPPRRLWLIAPAVIAAAALPLHVASKYAEFAGRARPFIRMAERAEPGSNVLFLRMGPHTDPAVNVPVWNHFGAWVQILHGGYSNAGWFHSPTVVQYRRHLPSPPYSQHARFDPAAHARPYRYILVHREARPLFPPGSDEFRLVDQEGEWKLYERVGQGGGI